MTNKIIEAARLAGGTTYTNRHYPGETACAFGPEALARFYAIARAEALEDAARVAEDYCQQYKKTKEAHERLSMEPFRPERFGFWPDRLHQSQKISDAIRTLKEQQHG